MTTTITTDNHTSPPRSANPIIEAYLQKASAAVTQLLTVVAEELERDRPHLTERSNQRLRDLVTSAAAAADLLLQSE